MPRDQFQFQRVGDYFELRREYRATALTALRKREGLPSPVDADGNLLETRFDDAGNATYHDQSGQKVERVLWQGAGRDGKPGSTAVGQRRGPGLHDADQHWGGEAGDSSFDILEVAEDGTRLVEELRDLHRDSATYERAERVSHGSAGEQAPELFVGDPDDSARVERELMEYLKRGRE